MTPHGLLMDAVDRIPEDVCRDLLAALEAVHDQPLPDAMPGDLAFRQALAWHAIRGELRIRGGIDDVPDALVRDVTA